VTDGHDDAALPERWAWAEVDLDAVRANVAWLRNSVAPAEVWAVVKANGYGHGAVPVGRAALEAGAAGLCVALVHEGVELRRAGICAPLLVLSEPPPEAMPTAVVHGLDVTVYSAEGVESLAAAAKEAGGAAEPVGVHLKVDTGMRRVGAEPSAAVALAERIDEHEALRLAAVFTHVAVADLPGHGGPAEQLDCFDGVVAELAARGIEPAILHVANSAGAIAHPRSRRSFVRAGIAVYGLPPSPAMRVATSTLQRALSLKARVSFVKQVRAGERVSYGWHHTFRAATTVATLPIGYADGVPRRLFGTSGCVLIGGRRCAIVGVVTMDQLMVDCGPGASVERGDEAVLIGRQGDEEITADEWADRLGTINYEVVCGIGARVPRRYVGTEGAGETPQ
jgi:alanine racemase